MNAPTAESDRERTTIEVPTGLERDELFRLLKSERRRTTLRYLLEYEGEAVGVEPLATAIVDEEDDHGEAEHERIATALIHAHLPKLDEAGVVEYDPDRDRVAATSRAALCEPYLGPVRDVTADAGAEAPTGGPVKPALTGWGGRDLATGLLSKVVGVAAAFRLALLVAASTWTDSNR
jgi:hypothetical protein